MAESKKGYHPLLFYTLVVIGAFVVGVIIFNFVVLPMITGSGDIVIVPELRGMTVVGAEESCRQRSLKLMVVGERYSDEIKSGLIMEQDPSSGEGLKGRRTVKVIVSSGQKMETVPDLVDKTLREAELSITGAQLRKGHIARVFSAGKGPSRVAASNPPGGQLAASGSDVDLLVSMSGEPKVYLMPDLVGKDLMFVRERLESNGFHVTRVVSRRDESRFPGTILSQTPPPGYSIKEGGTIELVVSTVE
jgi:serine/threonine-protein kinase